MQELLLIEDKDTHCWKDKPLPINQLDFIVGDRKSDLGAGWARGIRLFKVNPNIGLAK